MPLPTESLPDDPGTLKAMLIAERVRNERLVQIIKELQRHRFGRRAETLPEDQMLLALEDVEQAESIEAAAAEQNAPEARAARAQKRRVNRARCRPICRASKQPSILTTRPAVAVRRNCTGSGRM
jgi:transposase